MLSLQEYDEISARVISANYPYMLNNQSFKEWISGYLMQADWKFNGNGSIEGFRKQYARYGYLKWLRDNSNLNTEIPEFVTDTNKEIDNIETRDLLSVVDDREKKILELYHLHGYTLKEIANMLGISAERVNQLKKRAYNKIRKCV